MDLQTSFDILSRIVKQYESNGRTVQHVEATASEADGDTLHVTMDIPVALCSASGGLHPDFTPETATLTEGDGLQVGFSTSVLAALPPTTAGTVSASNQSVRVADDSSLLLTVELTIDPNGGETRQATAGNEQSSTEPSAAKEDESSANTVRSAAAGHHDKPGSQPELADLTAVRDESLPAYEDTEYLQRLYDSCDTFAEMSQKIEMDVTAETVRRYMIETSIHNPTTYNTATVEEQADEHLSATAANVGEMETDTTTDSETEATTPTPTRSAATNNPGETTPGEQLVTDGIGLPEGLQVEDIMDAVVDSVTVHEVQRHLGLERQPTRELLEQLNLLDVVMRRIADNPEQEVSYEEVATRIRQRAVGGA